MTADAVVADPASIPLSSWLLAYAISLARPTAILTVTPAFTRTGITGVIRTGVATVLAMPSIPVVAAALPQGSLGAGFLAGLIVKELLIGLALGLVLSVPFFALNVAGDVLDAQRGATQGRLNDPAGFDDVSITGTFLLTTGVTLFVAAGGFQTLADLLYRSWEIWRPLDALPILDARTPTLLLGSLDTAERLGLILAAPPVLAMLVSDAGMLIVARMAPQLRIDDLSLATRNIVFFGFLPLYTVYLIFYMRHDIALIPGLFDLVRQAAPQPGAVP